MKKLQFSVLIEADPAAIWKALWDDASYGDWTGAFSEGSRVVAESWEDGSKIHFLGPGGNGMYSEVARHVPNEVMSFRHIGVIEDGVEMPLDAASKKWTGAMENYILKPAANGNILTVQVDTVPDFSSYLQKTFPKALQRLKQIAEQ